MEYEEFLCPRCQRGYTNDEAVQDCMRKHVELDSELALLEGIFKSIKSFPPLSREAQKRVVTYIASCLKDAGKK